jgi:sugar-specific transcriptional regulator TrmB
MSKIIDYLAQLDLSDMEAKFYLKLLETGSISVSELAHVMDVKRTSLYVYLDPLVEKGLVSKIVSGGKKQIAPTELANVEALIDQKLTATKAVKEHLPELLQSVMEKGFTNTNQLDMQYFKGIHNARKIYLEALKAQELRSYVWIDKSESLFPSNANIFRKAFQENKSLKIWEIIHDPEASASPSQESRSQKGRYFYKYMPMGTKLSSEDILMYDGKVAVINFRGGKTSIVLQSQDLYNNLKEIFELVWGMLPEPQGTTA